MSSLVTRAACALSVALTVLSVLHFYWAFGGTWGLAAALGRQGIDASTGLRLAAGGVAIALLVAALFLAGLLNLTASTWKERLVFAPIAVALGVLALFIARSPRP